METYQAPSTDDRRIWDLWLTGTYQGAIVAADDAGLFAALAERPSSAEALAARLDLDERATGIVLRLLASLGLAVPRDGVFQLTDQARLYLVKSSPYYWGHMMRVGVSDWHVDTALEKLRGKGSAESVGPEGTPAPSGAGRPADGWATGKIDHAQAAALTAAMHAHSLPAAIGFARNYDFSGVRRMLDIGGGSGCFMIAAAQAHAGLRATIMELATMCELASAYIRAGGVTERVDTVALDMFRDPWPRDFDAMFFSNVWHDWNARTCSWLAERAYDALPNGGRIMLHEMLLDDDGAGPATAAAFSMLMLLATQGQQFTFGELRAILERAGFVDVHAVHTAGYYSVTTAYKR